MNTLPAPSIHSVATRHVLITLSKARHMAQLLAGWGYDILSVHVRDRNPVIEIAPPAHWYGARASKIIRIVGGRRQVRWVAVEDGVQIEWESAE